MGSTVRANSNFRHFVNSLRKRGYQYAAGYAAAVGTTVPNATTAAEVWRHTKDVTALHGMLGFFRMVCDSPPLQEAFRIAHVCNLTAAEKVERIHELVPSPFALIDSDGETVQPARQADHRKAAESAGAQICDRCNDQVPAEQVAQGWPIIDSDGASMICANCYGGEAFCPEGHVLPADDESYDCATCAAIEDAS